MPLAMMMVTVPPGVAPGQTLQITSPAGQPMHVQVPQGVLEGHQFQVQMQAPAGTTVQAQNAQIAAGAISAATPGLGGIVARNGDTANAVTNTLGNNPVKRTGDGVMVPCSSCGAENQAKMVMGSRAQFTCGHCGALVLWRPRQVWLRDQGMPLEKSIHPQPGEVDGAACCVLL